MSASPGRRRRAGTRRAATPPRTATPTDGSPEGMLAALIGHPQLRGPVLVARLRGLAAAASRIGSPAEARLALERALRRGDEGLALAVAVHAENRGWPGLTARWATARPGRAALLIVARPQLDELFTTMGDNR